jgi:hypothetical protein
VKNAVISAASFCVLAALPGCSTTATEPTAAGPMTTGPATTGPATTGPATSRPAATDPATSPAASAAFTVAGDRPVPPSGSQDTHAQAPGAVCDSTTFDSDEAKGTSVAAGFDLAGFPTAADLLDHFLQGTGTPVSYRAGSPISAEARKSRAFLAVNGAVQQAIARQLRAGTTQVELSAAQLPTVAFESENSDLYWAFRGTQGLTVTGRGSRVKGRYTGTLTYVIRDSYGFPAGDALDGFGPPMRYLQTACGAPQHHGGARWFPDSVAVTVAFSQPT